MIHLDTNISHFAEKNWHHCCSTILIQHCYFLLCLDEPVLAGISPSLDALPRLIAELTPVRPACIGAVDILVASLWISAPVGMPRWRRVLVLLSRSLEYGLGESAVNNKTK